MKANQVIESATKRLNDQRFTQVVVNRKKTGLAHYNAKIASITGATLRFRDVKAGAVVSVPLKNVVRVG